MLNCLLQHTLRSLCSSPFPPSSDLPHSSSTWVYAVFWRILPRNYPPPRILVWEDGYCDFFECERAGSGYNKGKFGADIFFKMSHEVYNYGEGLMGKVAADNSHKWVFREISAGNVPSLFTSWNGSLDLQPRAWESQFNSGIQVTEDLNLVINIQRKFNYLQSIPGIFSMQRPYISQSHNTNALKLDNQMADRIDYLDDKQHVMGGKRFLSKEIEESPTSKCVNLGWNSPQNRGIFWSAPPLLPPMSHSLGALLSKLPAVIPQNNFHAETQKSTEVANNSGVNIGDYLAKIPVPKPNNSMCESHAMKMEISSYAHETKLKTQKLRARRSWEDPEMQLESRAQPDEESAPHVLDSIVQ
ncbi:hypothetical protein ACLOJK_003905 [Asimina triloba]